MSNAPAKSAAPAKSPTPAPAQTNPVRMGILLGLLAVVLLMLAHHFAIAKPATDKAFKEIQELFDKRNARGVVAEGAEGAAIDAKLLKPKEVQDHIKKQPWSTEKKPDYTVETYWWYGMPHQNYVTVLYYGSGDNLRFNTHYLNMHPPAEDLPGAIINDPSPATPSTTPPTTGETGKPSTGTPPMTETPATETPATEKPEPKPAEEKPTDPKPAEEKPAAAEATEEKK
jgi:hypothetical protein